MRIYYAMPVMAKALGKQYGSGTHEGVGFQKRVSTDVRKGVLVARNFGGTGKSAKYGASRDSIGRWAGVCLEDLKILQRALDLAAEVMEAKEPTRFKKSQGLIDKETHNGHA